MYVDLKKQTFLPIFLDGFQQVKYFSHQCLRVTELPLELQSYWVRASYGAASRSAWGVFQWWACYQGFGWEWNLSDPWVARTTSSTLCSRVVLRQGSALGPQTVGLLPSVHADRCASGQIYGKGKGPWVGKSVLGWWLRVAETKLHNCFRFRNEDWGLHTWLWRHR